MIKSKLGFILILFLYAFQTANAVVNPYPVMPGVTLNSDFKVKVNDGSGFQNIPVQDIVDVCFVHFVNTDSIEIEITVSQPINTWRIGPERLGISPVIKDSTMKFTIVDSAKIIVLINEDAGNHTKGLDGLCILADAPERDVPSLADPNVINIMDYNVDSTGVVLARSQIQQAFDEHDGQNKIIYFPPGIYKSGLLHMRNNQSIYLAPGAVLKGSDNYDDYDPLPEDGNTSEEYLLGSWNADNIKVYGRGIIDGNGTALRLQDPFGKGFKTHSIQFQGSQNVLIEGIISLNAGSWSIEPIHCDNVIIRNVKVLSDLRYYDSKINTDGIDINKCTDVLVEDCLIWSGDDAITPKQDNTHNDALHLRNVYNHIYRKIVVFTRKCAVKIGSETYAQGKEFSDMTFEDFDVVYADRAICIWSDRGALVTDIKFENFYIEKISTEYKQSHINCRIDKDGNSIKNIDFININANEPAPLGSTFNGDNLNSVINDEIVQYYNIRFSDYTIGGEPVLSLDDSKAKFNLRDDSESADPSAFSFEYTTSINNHEPNSETSIHNFNLQQNSPNPFNPKTVIQYSIVDPAHVRLTVYNLMGQKVNTLVDEMKASGFHQVVWSGFNNFNEKVSGGLYLYRLDVNSKTSIKKMVMMN